MRFGRKSKRASLAAEGKKVSHIKGITDKIEIDQQDIKKKKNTVALT